MLAGGLGSRLGALAAERPKPLLPIGDKPFLAWLLGELLRFGVRETILLAGHMSVHIERSLEQLHAALPIGMDISVSVEPFAAGTGGALFHAREKLAERFFLLNAIRCWMRICPAARRGRR